MSALRISNKTARHLWLAAQGLGPTPTGKLNLAKMIHDLGFVQLDTIQVIARAQHHIIWSRNQNYREPMLNKLMQNERGLFEHFTHDASVLPMEFLPMWRRQFKRLSAKIEKTGWYSTMPDAAGRAAIKGRIRAEGPLSTHAFDSKVEGKKEMWARPPHKLGLDFMWYNGELATSHREGFTKHYDLAERVFPEHLRMQDHDDAKQIDWLCRAALKRMGFGSTGEIQRFWEAMSARTARAWAEQAADLQPVEVQGSDGSWTQALAMPDIEARVAAVESPTTRLRILNPFDPVIRDRNRLERLFGFEYRNEMFVPAAKRKWGYYVFPLLEGDRFVGRIEAKAERAKDRLNILKIWREPRIKWTAQRAAKLNAEIERIARFAGVSEICWECGATPD